MIVLGGAGEGRQHLSPSGEIPNRPEVKTDEELPAYCSPPNPCPLGFEGTMIRKRLTKLDHSCLAENCDASSMAAFTAVYSRFYQSEQTCRCDSDHDRCSPTSTFNFDKSSSGMLKRSRRLRRVCLFLFSPSHTLAVSQGYFQTANGERHQKASISSRTTASISCCEEISNEPEILNV